MIMASTKTIKVVLLAAFTLFLAVWLASGTYTKIFSSGGSGVEALTVLPDDKNKDAYVGSETCQSCHEDQFKDYSGTKHARLADLEGWKNKVQGCESCHGPGKEHVEGGGDKAKIISFKNKNAKEISESCLACHAGKEAHNNFRRGDHWRNNVGCTDCHTAHGNRLASFKPGSITEPATATRENPTDATLAMLKKSEPQLCISCHSETKAQFSKPFRHKVLEGAMKCSDCHNAHGGFEKKQTRLAVGADESCLKCHSDKQGPFVFEHAPLKVEGCSACHTPHGSQNPKMLKRPQVRQLCFECHSGITDQLSDGPTGGPHSQSSIRSQNCTVCHASIHGSNTSNVFFR
jgi:predicted CXXCH cytochrome family protein